MVKHIGLLLIMFLMLICFGFSISYSGKLKSMNEIVMLYLDEPLKASQVLQIQSAEMKRDIPAFFTGWVQKDGQDLLNKEFNRHVEADVVYVSGDSSLVLESAVSLKADDEDGCLISKDTAYELFGSMNVKNKKLMIGDRTLSVRGLLDKQESTVVVQATMPAQSNTGQPGNTAEDLSSREMGLWALAVDTSGLDRDKAEKAINELKGRYGINAKAVDHQIYMDLAGFFSAIFPLILAAVIVLSFVKKGITVRNKPFLRGLYLFEGFVFLLSVIWISKAHFSIPESMTPNRWSDFDFWRRISEDYFKDVQQLVYSSKQRPEIDYFVPVLKAAGCSLSAVLLFCISNLKLKMNSSRKLFILLCISLIMEFIIIIMVNRQGLQLRNPMMIWLMYPLYLVGKHAVETAAD